MFWPVMERFTSNIRTMSATSCALISIQFDCRKREKEGCGCSGGTRTSTVTSRFNRVASLVASCCSSGNCKPQSVNIRDGLTLLTRILGAQISDSVLIRWICAALLIAYGTELPPGLTPARLAVVINAPCEASRCGFAACISQKCALTLHR